MSSQREPGSERRLGALQGWLFERVTRPAGAGPEPVTASDARARARVREAGLLSAGERIEIYRRAYWSRLVECLRDDYPAVAHLLGAAAFHDVCLDFIAACPPRSASLDGYGAPFAAFCAARPGAEFAAALARLEWAIVEVIHADAERQLDPAAFARNPGLDLERAGFEASPALRLLSLSHPAHEYYQAFLDGADPRAPQPAPTRVAVCRRGDDVWRVPLEAPLAEVLQQLVGGAPLGRALAGLGDVSAASAALHAAAVQRAFAGWVSRGFFAALRPDA